MRRHRGGQPGFVRVSGDAKEASNWILNDLLQTLNEGGLDVSESPLTAARLGGLILEVKKVGQRVRIILSRAHPDILRHLFELEVPEIQERIIEIKALARDPGHRAKVAVQSIDHKVDCVGACVGIRGSRIKNIVDELNGEKIDIVRWNESQEVYIMNAMKPAIVKPNRISFQTIFHSMKKALAIRCQPPRERSLSRNEPFIPWSMSVPSLCCAFSPCSFACSTRPVGNQSCVRM